PRWAWPIRLCAVGRVAAPGPAAPSRGRRIKEEHPLAAQDRRATLARGGFHRRREEIRARPLRERLAPRVRRSPRSRRAVPPARARRNASARETCALR